MEWNNEDVKTFKEGFWKGIAFCIIGTILVGVLLIILTVMVWAIIKIISSGKIMDLVFYFIIFSAIGTISGILSVRKQRKNQIES